MRLVARSMAHDSLAFALLAKLEARDLKLGRSDATRAMNAVLRFGIERVRGMPRRRALASVRNLGAVSADALCDVGFLCDAPRCPLCHHKLRSK